jgi:branched-chain amino acid transport system permease protein
MLGALFGLTLVPFTGYWLMLPLVLVFGFALGAVASGRRGPRCSRRRS